MAKNHTNFFSLFFSVCVHLLSISDQVHLLHQLCNVVAQLRGTLDSEDTAHDLHPKGGDGVELLKGGRLEAACQDLAIEAVQAKVVVLPGLFGDPHHFALCGLGKVGVNGILARLEVASSLQSALRIDQMPISELEGLLSDATLGSDNDTIGMDNMGNRALRVSTNLIKCMLLVGVSDYSVLVEAWV